MKAILLSIRPEWIAKILNGEKTIEVRKKFPKDYVGWVYLYCSKSKPRVIIQGDGIIAIDNKHYSYGDEELNGKVVARFWCDKVEKHFMAGTYYENEEQGKRFLEKCCLSLDEFINYRKEKPCYAIHISKLEIFDEPKYLCDFWNTKKGVFCCPLTKAPQNYCYIEGE